MERERTQISCANFREGRNTQRKQSPSTYVCGLSSWHHPELLVSPDLRGDTDRLGSGIAKSFEITEVLDSTKCRSVICTPLRLLILKRPEKLSQLGPLKTCADLKGNKNPLNFS